jgi:hypothetical protein
MMSASFIVGLGSSAAALGIGAAAGSSTLVASFVMSAAFPPLAIGAALAAGVWVLLQGRKGWRRVQESQLAKAKQELRKHLGDVRDSVRRYYFDVDLESGRFQNLVDEQFDRFLKSVGDLVRRRAKQRSEETQRELKRLKEQAEMDERQRTARLAELRSCVTEWDQVGKELQGVIAKMSQLDQALSGLTQPAVEAQSA